MGISGQTSVAPMRGCAPVWRDMSMSSPALRIARNAASQTATGSPTKVTTVRLVALPGSTLSSFTPSTDWISPVIWRMIAGSRPSLKFGTHSSSCLMGKGDGWESGQQTRIFGVAKPIRPNPKQSPAFEKVVRAEGVVYEPPASGLTPQTGLGFTRPARRSYAGLSKPAQ